MNQHPKSKLVIMDSTNLEYEDNSFDTVIDTFGLQTSYNYKKQYEEMKRVCKPGGKILLLEVGESLWKISNYKTIKNSEVELRERGQRLFINWDDMILRDPDIQIIESKRKIHGKLYYYNLKKL
jgi:methyltransferase OMS1